MIKHCLHNQEMTRGEALTSRKIMNCHECLIKVKCRNQKGDKE